MEAPLKRRKIQISIHHKLMDYLARRDHSEKELRQKLKKFYTIEEIDLALTVAKDRKLIPSCESELLDLSSKVARALHRKKKGFLYINQYLKKKGLPSVKLESDLEYEKALYIVQKSQAKSTPEKLIRKLLARGFTRPIIHLALKNGIAK